MTHQEKIGRWIRKGEIGVEIGAFKTPIQGLDPAPFYVDCFKEFAAEKVFADYYGDASHLPFRDNSLDYVLTSHVLEHVANPISALAEWHRVLRPGGLIYLVVPDYRFTWDHLRPLTTVEHMWEDFRRGTTACDATHIDEFAFKVDWASYSAGTPAHEVPDRQASLAAGMRHAVKDGRDINIHFHTFSPENVLALFASLGSGETARLKCEVVDHAERFPSDNPNGFLAVARVRKTWKDRLQAWHLRGKVKQDRRNALQPDAKPFAEWKGEEKSGEPDVLACIDLVTPQGTATGDDFTIQGWVHIAAQANIVAVEAWAGGALLGATQTLQERTDVVAALGLRKGELNGFTLPLKVGMEKRGAFELQIRLQDGSVIQAATGMIPK